MKSPGRIFDDLDVKFISFKSQSVIKYMVFLWKYIFRFVFIRKLSWTNFYENIRKRNFHKNWFDNHHRIFKYFFSVNFFYFQKSIVQFNWGKICICIDVVFVLNCKHLRLFVQRFIMLLLLFLCGLFSFTMNTNNCMNTHTYNWCVLFALISIHLYIFIYSFAPYT